MSGGTSECFVVWVEPENVSQRMLTWSWLASRGSWWGECWLSWGGSGSRRHWNIFLPLESLDPANIQSGDWLRSDPVRPKSSAFHSRLCVSWDSNVLTETCSHCEDLTWWGDWEPPQRDRGVQTWIPRRVSWPPDTRTDSPDQPGPDRGSLLRWLLPGSVSGTWQHHITSSSGPSSLPEVLHVIRQDASDRRDQDVQDADDDVGVGHLGAGEAETDHVKVDEGIDEGETGGVEEEEKLDIEHPNIDIWQTSAVTLFWNTVPRRKLWIVFTVCDGTYSCRSSISMYEVSDCLYRKLLTDQMIYYSWWIAKVRQSDFLALSNDSIPVKWLP